jgi:thiamine-monophosphate kinase
MLSEFELIGRYFTHRPRHTVLGVGDDAALLRVARGCELAVSVDMLVGGRHFFSDADPFRLGHKALAVNLSDLAAMGARARWATLALALPKADPAWLAPFARGFMALARKHGVDLIGGDTTRGPLNICVQIMGEVERGTALRRDGAKPRDDIWVSGTLGAAALAVASRTRRLRLAPAEMKQCVERLDRPTPRLALGRALRTVAHSAIDISDGLAADLGHILERSGVRAEIEFAALPAARIVRRHLDHPAAVTALIAGGDDYELCCTAPASARGRMAEIARRSGVALTRIGHIAKRSRSLPVLRVLGPDGAPMKLVHAGFDHFG